MRRTCFSSIAGVSQAPAVADLQQLLVRSRAPEEERQARREIEIADAVVLARPHAPRGVFLEPEEELRAREDRLQRRPDARLEVAVLAAFVVELHQAVDVFGR